MTNTPLKVYAAQMELRPNPVMVLHHLLCKRAVLHLDVFAAVYEQDVLFVIELRRGGRGEPVETQYWLSRYGSQALPERLKDGLDFLYSTSDRVRFNNMPREWYDWAVQYHHTRMRALVAGIVLPPHINVIHRSTLFHYFKAYDLDPAKGFQNFKRMNAAQRYRALNWSSGEELL